MHDLATVRVHRTVYNRWPSTHALATETKIDYVIETYLPTRRSDRQLNRSREDKEFDSRKSLPGEINATHVQFNQEFYGKTVSGVSARGGCCVSNTHN